MTFCVNNWDLNLRVLSTQQKFQFEILEIPCAQWNVHCSCTDLTQATAHFIILLVSNTQIRAVYWEQ